MVKVAKENNHWVIYKSIKQGKNETLRLTPGGNLASPKNLTGYTATLKLKKAIDDTTIIDNMASPARITLGATAPTVVCTWNTAKTASFNSDLIGDLEIINPSNECEHSYRIKLIFERRVS